MSLVLITGASGFVGGALYERIRASDKMRARPVFRNRTTDQPADAAIVEQPFAVADWSTALHGVTTVVHAAARVHVMDETASDPDAAFEDANVKGTMNLARQSAAARVRRFVFVSSIKVNGEQTEPGKPFRATDRPAPEDAYGRSKALAEKELLDLARETGMEVVIVRPVLVYGPGVKANFAKLMTLVRRGVPLPLGNINNRRSLVSLQNLVDLLVVCLDHPCAAGRVFLVADGPALSTAELIRKIAYAFDRRALLIPVSPRLLESLAAMLGRQQAVRRLCGSLEVDFTATCETLGWRPSQTLEAALQETVDSYTGSR